MTKFYVLDFSKLPQYGAEQNERGNWYMRTNKAKNAHIDSETGEVEIYSPSTDFIALLCKMYKDGVIGMYKQARCVHKMIITSEEKKLIMENRRKQSL